MKKIALLLYIFTFSKVVAQPSPCSSNPVYRQFDFWIGEWEAFGPLGKKTGDRKISSILDSYIILEEWTSTTAINGVVYAGKSLILIMQSPINGSKPG